MFYRIQDNKLYDYANYNYGDDCLETDIITQEELDEHRNKVIVQNGVLVINPNYEQEEEEKQQEQFQKDFFNTSLGYVRRKVHMLTGEIKDFLTDILPLLVEGVEIITYNIDGTQNVGVSVTTQFINECKQQLLADFYGAQLEREEE